MAADDCIFCRIARREIGTPLEYEDDRVVAFKDLHPQAPVHLLVIPKKHIEKIGDVGPEESGLLLNLIQAANEMAVKFGLADDGYRLVINSGDNGGQTVYHLHIHLLGGRIMNWPPG